MEIVDTERTYVNDLQDIIQVSFRLIQLSFVIQVD